MSGITGTLKLLELGLDSLVGENRPNSSESFDLRGHGVVESIEESGDRHKDSRFELRQVVLELQDVSSEVSNSGSTHHIDDRDQSLKDMSERQV